MLIHLPFYSTLLGRQLKNGVVSTTTHVLLYGAIEAHSLGEKGCIASNKTLAKEIGKSEKRVANALSEISQAGWVLVGIDLNNHRIGIVPMASIKFDSPLPSSGNPPFPAVGTPLPSSGNIEYSLENNIDNTSRVGEPTLPRSEIGSEIEKVYSHYLSEFGASRERYKLTPKRAATIKRRINELNSDAVCRAITNCARSPWHRGENNRGWKADLDFIIRSYEQVESWANKETVEVKIPDKPTQVKDMEHMYGKKYAWNPVANQWMMTNDPF